MNSRAISSFSKIMLSVFLSFVNLIERPITSSIRWSQCYLQYEFYQSAKENPCNHTNEYTQYIGKGSCLLLLCRPVFSLMGKFFDFGLPQLMQRSGNTSLGGFVGALMVISTVITQHLLQCLQKCLIIHDCTRVKQNFVVFRSRNHWRLCIAKSFQELIR